MNISQDIKIVGTCLSQFHGDEDHFEMLLAFSDGREVGHVVSRSVAKKIATEFTKEVGSENAVISELRAKLFPYADATEISGISWDGKYLIGDKASITFFHEMKNRGEQIDVYKQAYDQNIAAKNAELASANAELVRLRSECRDGLDALSDIDDFWEACPYPDNRKHLSPAEQISSLDSELNKAHDENARFRGMIEEAQRILDGAEPEYHQQGMGCGLEDRGITDRYDAMEHGWEKAMERVYGENIAWAKDAFASALKGDAA